MTKQIINIGTSANKGNGDPLRTAFTKVNENFDELYTALGLNVDGTLSLGAFEFTGSVMSTTDSTAITIDQATTVTSNLTVGGDILPSLANGGNLGSSTAPWRSLYVSNNTIYLGGVPLSIDGSNNLLVNNQPISGSGGSSVTTSATAPTSPALGDLWYDTVSGRTYVYYDSSWIDANPVDGAGISSTSELVNGSAEVILGSNGVLTFPNGETLVSQPSQLYFHKEDNDFVGEIVLQAGGVGIQSIHPTLGNSLINITTNGATISINDNEWGFNRSGTLTTPLLLPKTFNAVLDNTHLSAGTAISGDVWQYAVEFQVNPNGSVQTMIDGNQAWPTNPGYNAGHEFEYAEEDHGIPGYTFVLTLASIADLGPIGFGGNIVASEPPTYPSTVKSLGAVKLSADDEDFVLGTDGSVTFPDGLSIKDSVIGYASSNTVTQELPEGIASLTTNNQSQIEIDNTSITIARRTIEINDDTITTSTDEEGSTITVDSSGIRLKSYTEPEGPDNSAYIQFKTTGSAVMETVVEGAMGSGTYGRVTAGPEAVEISVSDSGVDSAWLFYNDGVLTLPTAGKISVNSVQATDLAELETIYNDAELTYQDVITQWMELATFKPVWFALPGRLAYDQIITWTSPGTLPLLSIVIPTAKAAQDAYIAWQEAIALSKLSIKSDTASYEFDSTGKLKLAQGGVIAGGDPVAIQAAYDDWQADEANWQSLITEQGNDTNIRPWNFAGPSRAERRALLTDMWQIQNSSPSNSYNWVPISSSRYQQVRAWLGVGVNQDGYENWKKLTTSVNITAEDSAWTFTNDGVVTLPEGGTITNTQGGIKLATSRGTLALGTEMEAPTASNHFHIAFDGSNGMASANALFLGDDYNYVKINSGRDGVAIGTGSEFIPVQNWSFGTNGTLALPNGAVIRSSTNSDVTGALTAYNAAVAAWESTRINDYLYSVDNTPGITIEGWPFAGWDDVSGTTADAYLTTVTNAWIIQQTPSSPPSTLIFQPAITSTLYNQIRSGLLLVINTYAAWQALLSSVDIVAGSETLSLLGNNKIQVPSIIQTSIEEDIIIRARYSAASSPSGTIAVNKDFIFSTNGSLTFKRYDGVTEGNAVIQGDISGNLNLTAGNYVNIESSSNARINIANTTANTGVDMGNSTSPVRAFGNLQLMSGRTLTFADSSVQSTAYVKTTGTWTVTSGTNNYSFTVPANGAYQLWVRGNIPNGIISYIATVHVTNPNVPVLGTQRAWNYTGAGDPLLLTSIPSQIIGTEGTISTGTITGTTNNVFVFGINNTSGSNQTVSWGYVTL